MKHFLTKPLAYFTLKEYDELKSSGMLWEYYPESTGNSNQDLQAVCVEIKTSEDGVKTYVYDIWE